jgi:hypothetical protein
MENRVTESSKPKFSIGMPVYNGGSHLRETINSILGQSFRDFELIIGDDNSLDDSDRICLDFAALDSRIRYFRHRTNLGPEANFQFVLRQACAPLFTWSAQDDLMKPNYLELAIDYMESNPGALAVCSDFEFIDTSGVVFGESKIQGTTPNTGWESVRPVFFTSPMGHNNFFQYATFKTVQARPSLLLPLECGRGSSGIDLVITSRLAAAGELHIMPGLLRRYRVHEKSDFMTQVARGLEKPWIARRWDSLLKTSAIRYTQYKILWTAHWTIAARVKAILVKFTLDFRRDINLLRRGVLKVAHGMLRQRG